MIPDDPIYQLETLSTHEQTFVRGKPKPYLLETIALFNQLPQANSGHPPRIVEIGSIRRKMNHDVDALCLKEMEALKQRGEPLPENVSRCSCNDGHATYFWAHYTNAIVDSVDIDGRIKALFQGDPRLASVRFHAEDGIEYLRGRAEPIDLLFLDAWDVTPEIDYAAKHLDAFRAAAPNLAHNAMILIDDTDIGGGGKGKLLCPVLEQEGFLRVFQGRQTLFRKLADTPSEGFSIHRG